MKNLSIVIPTTGRIESLNTLLISLQKLTSEYSLQTIVVCNPQNDLINMLPQQYLNMNVVVMQNTEVGVNKARQKGLQLAKNDFVLFLDDDCELMNVLDINVLYNEITNSSILFAVGGGYSFEPQNLNYFAKNYAQNQIQWLKQGFIDIQKNESAYLIGGFFILNKVLCDQYQMHFDTNIIFGGSEKEFFLQAYKKKLQMRLLPVNIKHHYENKKIVFLKKMYKQGRGQRYIENKGLLFKPKYLSLVTEAHMTVFDILFWAGYFLSDGEYLKYFRFLLKKIVVQMNEKKITTLNKVKKNL